MAWWNINQWLVSSDSKWDPDKDVDALAFKLIDKGFHFNVEKDWYERTWVVATKDGAETSKEVYQKKGEHWKVIMFGDKGDVFFEKKISNS